jgi:ADP-ribosylglycohydrolase
VPSDRAPRFARVLAGKLRWWVLGLPAAVGWGTLRALARSWIGFSPARSGVWSAGNGAVMRAPIIPRSRDFLSACGRLQSLAIFGLDR